jgi:DNA-binding transcriptional LysR family regulator
MENLDGLTVFLAVGRHKSFSAAAAELGVSTPAVSNKIKLLEQRFSVVLFQRTTRRVALTEPGAALFERLKPALAEIEDALAGLSSYRGRPSGKLRLTAPRPCAEWLMAPLLLKMRAQYPELAIEVSLDDAFIDLVQQGFDAGIRLGDSVEKDMQRVPITKHTDWAIVGSPEYLAEAGRPSSVPDLTKHRTIRQRLLASGQVYRWELEERGRELTIDVPGGLVVDDIPLMVALARGGAGLAYVPAEAVAPDLAQGTLEAVMRKHITRGPGFCLYFPARTQEQPKLRALIDVISALRGRFTHSRGAFAGAKASPSGS